MNGIAKRFATGNKVACFSQTDSAPDGPHQWHTCAGTGLANATFALEEWPHRRYICAGTVLRVAFLASFGALPLDCVPVHVTRAFRRNMNQRRRGWFVIPSPTLHRCHDCTATVLRFDWDRRPTILIGLSLRASRAQYRLVVACYNSPRHTSGETSRILLSFSPAQHTQRSTRTQ